MSTSTLQTTQTRRVTHLYQHPDRFTEFAGSLPLRPYQIEPLNTIIDSIRHQRGDTFVVIFPRQSGKNETQAALFTWILFAAQLIGGNVISVSPTYKPQTENAMRRLETRLRANILTRADWHKAGYVWRIGQARVIFFSGETASKVVGETASLLMSVDEAQDVSISKYDKEFEPMLASTNGTRVFWGTRWTSDTLLEREYTAARIAEKRDGRRRVFFITADDVSAVLPPYAAFVQGIINKHGRNHPLVKTQYFGETIDAEAGMFPPARMALLKAPTHWKRPADMPTAFLIDCAGTDEAQRHGEAYLANPGRDSTTLSMCAIDLSQLETLQAPIYRIYDRRTWTGTDPVQIFGQVQAIAETADPQYFVVDGTGVGDGLAALLTHKYGPDRVIVVRFTARVKSDTGYRLISIVETGRLRLHSLPTKVRKQYASARTEVLPGPSKTLQWGVPDALRDEKNELIHDDHLLADSLTAALDLLEWRIPTDPGFAYAMDPIADMDTFKP